MRVPVGGLNFLPVVPKEGVPWFSDQLAQMWGRRGSYQLIQMWGRGEGGVNLKAISCQRSKNSQPLYYRDYNISASFTSHNKKHIQIGFHVIEAESHFWLIRLL